MNIDKRVSNVIKASKPVQLKERVRPQHLRNELEDILLGRVKRLARSLQEDQESFKREKAKKLMIDLQRIGFSRVKEMEKGSKVCMGVEYTVRQNKSLIIIVGIEKSSKGMPIVTVDRFRYKDEANYIENYRRQ